MGWFQRTTYGGGAYRRCREWRKPSSTKSSPGRGSAMRFCQGRRALRSARLGDFSGGVGEQSRHTNNKLRASCPLRKSFQAVHACVIQAAHITEDDSFDIGKAHMQASAHEQHEQHEHIAQHRPQPQPHVCQPAEVNGMTSGSPSLSDPLELESLKLVMDASLRVHARHHFFTWTQGLLQNLVKHEALICALRNAEPMSFHVDSFSTSPLEPALFSDMFRQDTSMVPHIIKTWEENSYRPVVCETGSASPFAQSALWREFIRIAADTVIAHGTYDAFGKPASFFVFACRFQTLGPRQVYCVELIVPFLQQAWVRTQIDRPVIEGAAAAHPAGAGVLTSREQEVLKWVHRGKSNIEIGTILEISPLTVKNHVQKILRKLNVQNRTQAVGKAIALRILTI